MMLLTSDTATKSSPPATADQAGIEADNNASSAVVIPVLNSPHKYHSDDKEKKPKDGKTDEEITDSAHEDFDELPDITWPPFGRTVSDASTIVLSQSSEENEELHQKNDHEDEELFKLCLAEVNQELDEHFKNLQAAGTETKEKEPQTPTDEPSSSMGPPPSKEKTAEHKLKRSQKKAKRTI